MRSQEWREWQGKCVKDAHRKRWKGGAHSQQQHYCFWKKTGDREEIWYEYFLPETEEGLKCGTLCWGLEHLLLNICFVLFLFTIMICGGKKHCTKNLLFILAYTALFCRYWIAMKVKLIYCVLSLLKVLWLKSQHWSKNPLIEKLTQRETENT